MKAWTSWGPTMKGFVGAVLGSVAVLVFLGVLYVGWSLYVDHKTVAAIVKFINDAQQAQAKANGTPPAVPR